MKFTFVDTHNMTGRHTALAIGLRRILSLMTKPTTKTDHFRVLLEQPYFNATATTKTIQALNITTTCKSKFYESLDATLNDEKTLKSKTELKKHEHEKHFYVGIYRMNLGKLESNTNRYYFVKEYLKNSKRSTKTEKNIGISDKDTDWKILTSMHGSVRKHNLCDFSKPIQSVREFDIVLDTLFQGLQKFHLLTYIHDAKFHNYLRKVTAVYQDISVSLFNNFCDQNNNDEDMKKLFFNLAYCWLKAGSHLMHISKGSFQIRHWNAQSDYLLRFVAFYIGPKDDRTLRTLTPQEFLFCLVVAGSHRRLPGLNYHGKEFESKYTSFRIPKKIEDFFVLHYDEFNTFEIGFLVQALHMANVMPYNKLQDKIFATLMNMKNKEIIDADVVGHLLKIFIKSDRNPQMGKSVMLKLLPILNELSVPATVRLCTLLQVHCLEESQPFLEPLVNSVKDKIELFRMKDLYQTAFFLADLDAHTTGKNIVWKQGLKGKLSPDKELFYDGLMLKAASILEKNSTHINDSPHFIAFVFQMSRLSYYSEYVIDKLIRTVNETKSLKNANDGDEMLTKGTLELFSKLRGKYEMQNKIKTEGYQILAKRKHAHALKNILELDNRLDRIRRNYKGARLNADLKIKLKDLVGDVSAIGRIQSNSLNEN